MTPSRWDRVSALFHEASQLPPEERPAYLIGACPDESLREEVQSLLAHASGDDLFKLGPRFVGKMLSHYQVTEHIGEGSMGHVYKARDTVLSRTVALKFLPPDFKGDARGAKRLLREAKSASALNHPNIVTIHAIDRDEREDADFIVMEFIAGQTLSSQIPFRQGLPVEQARQYALQIADALAAAHEKGILHGDLKPSNIMISEHGLVKLLDFGLARARTRELGDPSKSELFGTTAYMAPERIQAPLTDPRSEVFSYGMILYQMLSGEHPFGSGTRQEISERIRDAIPKALPPKVPPWLADIVQHCLEKRASDRFQSMQEVLHALKQETYPHTPTRLSRDSGQVHSITARITCNNAAKSRQAVHELKELFARGMSETSRQTAISALKEIILTNENDGVLQTVRKVRKLVMQTLKLFTSGHLGQCFDPGDLEELDFFQMDLSETNLGATSFRNSFLVEVDFRGSCLMEASLAGAFIRNANFADADLAGADFTDSDWFNAIGLTAKQLHAAQRPTLRMCPPNIAGMHRVLKARYQFPFESWAQQVQDQLQATWAEYLKPGGLRDLVAGWRAGIDKGS